MKSIIIVSLLLFCTVGGASAWYDGFDYRIPITIDNTGNPALEDYQFNVSFVTGINESSIRVVNDTDYTIVPHWCENETDGLCYELWFNVSIGSEVNTDYYIYYGNDSISSTSNYDSTFTKKYNNSGLVLELHMDEGTGNAVTLDSSGKGNHGTLTNMDTVGSATSGWQDVDGGQWDNRSGVIFADGDHLLFDGVNDYVDCGNDASLSPAAEITFSAWVNPKSLTVGDGLFDKYVSDVGLRSYRIFVEVDTSKLAFQISSTGNDNEKQIADMGIVTNEWQHVVLTYNSGVFEAYRNGYGVSVDNDFVLTSIHQSTTELFIGSRQADNLMADAHTDEVRIYNRSLSEDEIYRQYIRSKYAANTPIIGIGHAEKNLHPFLLGAYLFYGEMSAGLTSFRDGMGRYLIWGVVFFAVSLAFTLIAKIKHTLIGGK